MYKTLMTALDAIRNMPICELNKRQPMLVDLLVDLVDHETEGGELLEHHSGVQSQCYWPTLKAVAEDLGFTFLGAGHFSAAFSHEMLPGRVIKVGFKKEDSGAAYAAWCRMNQGRVGVPTIHAIARHQSCYTVVLDHLTRFRPSECEDEDSYCQYELATSTLHGHDMDIWNERSMDLKQTVYDIRAFFKDIASFDLHSDNVMLDSDGDLVITDPVSWTHKAALTQDKFHVDPDELVAEVSAYLAEQEERMEARRVELEAARRLNADRERNESMARKQMGRDHWRNVWLAAGICTMVDIEAQQAMKWRIANQMNIVFNRDLHIDGELDKALQG